MQVLLSRLVGQERARANARAAATELSRQRVEREDVELYLATLRPRVPGPPRARAGSAGGGRAG